MGSNFPGKICLFWKWLLKILLMWPFYHYTYTILILYKVYLYYTDTGWLVLYCTNIFLFFANCMILCFWMHSKPLKPSIFQVSKWMCLSWQFNFLSDPTTDGGFSTDYITDWQYSCEHRLTGMSDAHVTIRRVRILRGDRWEKKFDEEV